MPFITVTHPPKYPLTESEKKWLEERETRICKFCIHCPGYLHTNPCLDWWGDTCVVDTMLEEFRDAAEFESRVAAKLARGVTYGELPCGADPDCPDERMGKYSTKETPMVGCYMCVLRAARLAVEQEMEDA